MTADILKRIAAHKQEELHRAIQQHPLQTVTEAAAAAPTPRDFAAALRGNDVRLIAEVKKASPSAGIIRADFDPVQIAGHYQQNGAAALSVLTDESFFQGHLDYLRAVRRHVDLPVLRKDFTIDEYQIHEARAAGADAVLLIVALLDDDRLQSFLRLTEDLGMTALVEVHDAPELQRALRLEPALIGINNRDLRSFTVDLQTTFDLRAQIPAGTTVVSESGIRTREDLDRLRNAGVDAVLVGESLMRQPDVAAATRALLGR